MQAPRQETLMKHVLAVLLFPAPLAFAQAAQPSPQPTCAAATIAAFDVATVRPSDRPSGSSRVSGRSDTLITGGTALRLIEYAYNLHDFQVTGAPNWLNSTTWDVTAKVVQPPANWASLSGEAQTAIEQQRAQAVLAQRFTLKCHFENRELPVYNLVVAKGGPRPALTPTPDDAKKKGSFNTNGRNGANRMDANGVPLSSLASNLVWSLGRTVIDKTGLTGLYDFTLIYSDVDADADASATSGPTVFTALEEQLGLRLEPAKGPVPVLVIDSIARPSEN